VVLVNMTPNPYLEVETRIYRFRLLNGSNARTYRLAFLRSGSEAPLTYQVVGTDGGLLDRPRPATEVFLAPGERVDVLLDLTGFEAGEVVALKSLAFDPMHREDEMGGEDVGEAHGMGHGHAPTGEHAGMGAARLPSGAGFYVLRLAVVERVSFGASVPASLSAMAPTHTSGANARRVTLSVETDVSGGGAMMRWLIDRRTYDVDEYPIVVNRGSTEVWEIRNEERSMPHPMHLHGFQFRVLERTGSPEQVRDLVVDERGRTVTDLGWKDTVLVWPGETVSIAVDFSHGFEGEQLYLFHCHILEHEDAGMMLNFKVIEGSR
jgi:blue copper oxidase